MSPELILAFIRKLLEFPQGQICKHYVAIDLIDKLLVNNKSFNIPEELIKSIIDCDDETSINIINKLILQPQ